MKERKTKPLESQVAVRLPAELVEQIDRYVRDRNLAEPGISLTRSDAVRLLLMRALAPQQK